MTYEQIILAWINYAREVLPEHWTITRAESISGNDGPRPPKPYVTLKIISGPRQPTLDDVNIYDEQSESFYLVGFRGYTISFKSYGEGFSDALEEISTYLDDPEFSAILKQEADIAITSKGNVVDISAQLETGYERRASLDITFNSSNNKKSRVGLIEKVEVKGSISSNRNEAPITTNNEINKE